jgi:hypothetical protein
MKIQSKRHGEKLVYFDAEFLPELSPYQWYAQKKGIPFTVPGILSRMIYRQLFTSIRWYTSL